MFRSTKFLFLTFVSVLVISIISCQNSSGEKSDDQKETKISQLVGNWIRTDAGYRINIIKINDDGTLVAQYFNPQPINVGKASWEESYGNLKLTIELRDVNYPGSTYRLSYLHDKDMLAGEYYQAVEGLTFYVEFMRSK
jgi:hypothetical protein